MLFELPVEERKPAYSCTEFPIPDHSGRKDILTPEHPDPPLRLTVGANMRGVYGLNGYDPLTQPRLTVDIDNFQRCTFFDCLP